VNAEFAESIKNFQMDPFEQGTTDVKVEQKKTRIRNLMIGAAMILTIATVVSISVLLSSPYRVPGSMKGMVFISAQEAQTLENPVILDARDSDTLSDSIINAKHAKWSLFTEGENSGLVSDNLDLAQDVLRQLGVNRRDPVLVYGQWNDGWGEEGRLYWTLLLFNVTNSHILYGGINAAKLLKQGEWVVNNGPISISNKKASSSITVIRRDVNRSIRSTKSDIQAILEEKNKKQKEYLLLDVRSGNEYHGEGHISSALNWHWKSVFKNNNLKSCDDLIQAWGRDLDLSRPPATDVTIVSYCLGGIRSAFVFSVMASCGYVGVKNYDGSWWDWKD
jgi:thiosulfate/3-mercaptopyruvate sulfurtransferase